MLRSPGAALILLALASLPARLQSQTATPLPDAPTPQQQQNLPSRLPNETDADYKARIHAQAEHDVKIEETQRVLTVIPAANVVMRGEAVPLSPGQKTELAIHAAVDPFNVIGAFVLGGVDEVTDSYKGYGWGPAGYFKRAGANLADVSDATMLASAVYPILLHQDPRFFRQGTGTIKSRAKHALLAAFLCRGDDGRPQVNYSNLLGNLTAGAISNAYYPPAQRGAGLTFLNSSIVTVEGSAGTLALEFGPDLAAWWKRRHNARQAPQTAAHPIPTPSGQQTP
jgi:hypothetical protein